MSRRTAGAALVLLSALLGVTAPPAHAAWSLTSAGTAMQSATVVAPVGRAPTVVVTGVTAVARTYTLTWDVAWVQPGRPVTGYVITRTASLGTGGLTLGTCAGGMNEAGTTGVYVPVLPGAPVHSCTDTSAVNLGTVQYRVTPVYGRWRGPASPPSAAVT